MWIDEQLQYISNKGVLPPEMHAEEFFGSLYKESRVKLKGHPLHNQHINYYNHLSEAHRDRTPIHLPSKLFWFRYMKENLICEDQTENNPIPDCVMWIEQPSTPITKDLLSTCVRISQLQPVTDLCMSSVRCRGWPGPIVFNISKCVQSVTLYDCTLPSLTLDHLIHQISELEQMQIYHTWSFGSSLYTDIGRFHAKMFTGGGQKTNMSSVKIKHCNLQSQSLIHLIQQTHRCREIHMEGIRCYDDKTVSVPTLSPG